MPRKNKQIKHEKVIFNTSNCVAKRKFNNENEAQKAAEIQILQNPQIELNTYKCEICQKWHLTRRYG